MKCERCLNCYNIYIVLNIDRHAQNSPKVQVLGKGYNLLAWVWTSLIWWFFGVLYSSVVQKLTCTDKSHLQHAYSDMYTVLYTMVVKQWSVMILIVHILMMIWRWCLKHTLCWLDDEDAYLMHTAWYNCWWCWYNMSSWPAAEQIDMMSMVCVTVIPLAKDRMTMWLDDLAVLKSRCWWT